MVAEKKYKVIKLESDRSPCNHCRFKDIDKNITTCLSCKKREKYAGTIDPENICRRWVSSYSGRWEKEEEENRKIGRKKIVVDRILKGRVIDFSSEYCDEKFDMELSIIIDDTRFKGRKIASYRYQLIRAIKSRLRLNHATIARCLGMKYHTVNNIMARDRITK